MDMKDKGNGRKGGTNGSLGDATNADLERGYTVVECDKMNSEFPEIGQDINGGFAGRPTGYER